MKIHKNTGSVLYIGLIILLTGCGATNPPEISEGHIRLDDSLSSTIPDTVQQAPELSQPDVRPDLETYTVVVNQVPVRELLFSMARDANINIDIDNNIHGTITMNAIDQTLPKILERLSRQVAINYKLEDNTLRIMADKPYLHTYDIDYLNMSRISTGSVTVSTEINSTGGDSESGGKGGNNSSSLVENLSTHTFWKTITLNIAALLGEEIKASKSGLVQTSSNIIVNRETGIIAVRATFRQHEHIQSFIDRVLESAKRQVLIEATIAEVTLSDRYQSGVDWSFVSTSGGGSASFNQNLLGGTLGQSPFFSLGLSDSIGGNPFDATLKALETFGDVKVLSSPKVMALNNQTAMLKVVDNEVYFSIEITPERINSVGTVTTPAIINTDINTVPIGFVMSVTPFIDKNDVVTLNVRPTISRIVDFVEDPNPVLAREGVVSKIPVIQVREIESILKINNGDTAVIGGLMQDRVDRNSTGVPYLSSIPILGSLFSFQDDQYIKSELVIFIRPIVAHNASLTGDLKEYRKYLLDDISPPGDDE